MRRCGFQETLDLGHRTWPREGAPYANNLIHASSCQREPHLPHLAFVHHSLHSSANEVFGRHVVTPTNTQCMGRLVALGILQKTACTPRVSQGTSSVPHSFLAGVLQDTNRV